MKYLTVIRHAKSSWKYPDLSDIERPLNKRGYRAANLIGKYLRKLNHSADLMISSPAKRAYDTCVIIGGHQEYPESNIQVDRRLYFEGESGIISCLREINPAINSVFIFGHEPTMSSFTYSVSHNQVDKFSTAAVFAMRIPIDSWKDFGKSQGERVFFIKPKMLKEKDLD